MREKIGEELYKIASEERDAFIDEYKLDIRKSRTWDELPKSSKGYWQERTDQIHKEYIAWFLSEISKLEPLSDEQKKQILSNYYGSAATLPELIDTASQAQLAKTKEDLLKTLEGK